MKGILNLIVLAVFLISTPASRAQISLADNYKPDMAKVKMYLPYLAVRHGGPDALEAWKKENKLQYHRELWYYTESFDVVRDHFSEGVPLNEEIIDISRFEQHRKQNEEAIVPMPGFRDALRLKAGKDLLYKPEYVK